MTDTFSFASGLTSRVSGRILTGCSVALGVLGLLLLMGMSLSVSLISIALIGAFSATVLYFSNKSRQEDAALTARVGGIKLMASDLRDHGVRPECSDSELMFQYQGGCFRVLPLEDGLVRVMYPRIYSAHFSEQDLLCRLSNSLNAAYALVKLIMTPDQLSGTLNVHAFADITYTLADSERFRNLETLLGLMFDQQRSLYVAHQMATVPEMSEETGDIGLTQKSYRDFSMN